MTATFDAWVTVSQLPIKSLANADSGLLLPMPGVSR
jgi:hypothetical protein